MSYPVPAQQIETLYEIKKSKFIAFAAFADSREAAMAHLANVKQQYPDARHHCWAYLLGNPHSPSSAAMADDGEPSGTAGKPILNVLQHKGVGDVMVIVTRYFGGIKLGAGGLVRAYSASAQQAMEQLPTREEVRLYDVSINIDFKHEQFIRHLCEQFSGKVVRCNYAQHVTVDVQLPSHAIDEFQEKTAAMAISLTRSDND
ncbi:IMPACT family member YigZ [Alteromonas sp. 38]|uniref:YigZ family protein n=1 Tax=Alteromonas TaxID=226 RepID=UPI0012F24D90|nr:MULTISPECIES: YigZ family protein [Alteromonas]CAD5287804.1 IMPACT family member YigZ [Alteromonas sp. 154]VXB28456.1 IMPACT family member YigZ [Alteromonas sp. 38]